MFQGSVNPQLCAEYKSRPCPCPPHVPSCSSCNAVLESIALEETSIAHILNAEGEKIQKAVACATCISELLEVNQSVVKTIIHVTHLEQALYDKLEALCECCMEQRKPLPPCKPPIIPPCPPPCPPICNPCNPCNPCAPPPHNCK